jgi:hypothetical protein
VAATDRPFEDRGVRAAFESWPQPLRARLLALRRLIFDTAAATEDVGCVQETLKWGQPSYLTPETRSGSTVRIAPAGRGIALSLTYHLRRVKRAG